MKVAGLLVAFLCLALVEITLGNPTTVTPITEGCPILCPQYFMPVCGMEQDSNGMWLTREFDNGCLMYVANECEGGNYIRCDERASGIEISGK